jgi:putative RecB family exonuclease
MILPIARSSTNTELLINYLNHPVWMLSEAHLFIQFFRTSSNLQPHFEPYKQLRIYFLLDGNNSWKPKPELASMITSEKEWLDRATSLLKTYFDLENPTIFEPTHRELHLEQDLADDIYLHGYVDRLDVAPTGEVRIIDYKTGKSPKPGWEEKALFQLRVYALLYWKEKNVIPKLLQLIYLGDSSVLKNSPTEQELVATEKSLMKIADSIRKAIETDTWIPRKSKLCDWCSFKSICPAHN